MRLYLNAGFGERIGRANLRLIKELGFDGIRQDVPTGRSRDLVSEFTFTDLTPLFLVGGGKMTDTLESYVTIAWAVAACMQDLNVHGAIEIGNEPDIAGIEPKDFAALVRESARGVWSIDQRIPVICGGVMSTNERSLAYLEEVLTAGIPEAVIIGYHTYRDTHPDEPNPGFQNRTQEFHRLKNIINGRRMWNTEIGWHTAPIRRGFPLCWLKRQFTDEDVFKFLVHERSLNSESGAEVMVVYQLNDGPGDKPEDRFGIRRLDGTLKPSAEIARLG